VSVSLQGRTLGLTDATPDAFSYTMTPAADRSVSAFNFPMPRCLLLNCSFFASAGAPLTGQTYAMLKVARGVGAGALVLGQLLGGYVTAYQHLAYPGSAIENSIQGNGYPRTILGTTPAPGAEVLETVPAGARWLVDSFFLELACSAAAANRYTQLLLQPAIGANFYSSVFTPMIAGSNNTLTWAVGMQGVTQPQPGYQQMALGPFQYLVAGDMIRTFTTGLQAGDAYGTPNYRVREWLEVA
jgi:hypothetical protein